MSAEELKNQGNELLKSKNFIAAFDSYSKAIELDPSNYGIYSNRVLCLIELNRLEEALSDAEMCIALKDDWAKGYLRKASVLLRQNELDQAVTVANEGLKFEPENAQLKQMFHFKQYLRSRESEKQRLKSFHEELPQALFRPPNSGIYARPFFRSTSTNSNEGPSTANDVNATRPKNNDGLHRSDWHRFE